VDECPAPVRAAVLKHRQAGPELCYLKVQIPFKNPPSSIEVIHSKSLAEIKLWMKKIRTRQGR